MPETESGSSSGRAAGIGVVAAAVTIALAVIALTGGGTSPFLLLLALPLILATARCGFAVVLATGLLLGFCYLAITRPSAGNNVQAGSWPEGRQVLAAMMYPAMAVAGGLYARRASAAPREPEVTPAEREGLLGMAYTDPMTGLFNFRKFRLYLDEEMKRAARYGHPLSVILIDLDCFKGVNDRYGHPAGDRVLTGAAAVIRASVRETDLPARYGGEEFAVVCPETTADEATTVAERIRTALEKNRIEVVPGDFCAVTCSAGVASYPDHARDEASLIEAADQALYMAKERGKNRVHASTSSHASS